MFVIFGLPLIIFFTSRSRSSFCFWTSRVFKCFTAKSLDCSGGWQDHLKIISLKAKVAVCCKHHLNIGRMLLLTKLWARLEDIEEVVLKARARPRPPLWTLARAATCAHPQPRCATTASAAPPPSHCASSPSTEGQHWIFLSLQYNFRKEPTPNLLPLDLWEQRHCLSGKDPGYCSKVDLFGWRVFIRRRRICCHVADGAPPMSRTRPTHTSFQLVSTASTILASFIAGLNFVGPAVSFVSNFPCCVSIFSLQPSSIHFNKTILGFREKKLNTPTIR